MQPPTAASHEFLKDDASDHSRHSSRPNALDSVEKTPERFWILLIFGLSTMINACGWISFAPLFLLCEDVSSGSGSRVSRIVLNVFFILWVGLWYQSTDGQLDVILIYGAVPASKLPMRLCN